MTLSDLCPGFQGHDIFEVEYRKNKLSKRQSYYCTRGNVLDIWNGTMFGDLD